MIMTDFRARILSDVLVIGALWLAFWGCVALHDHPTGASVLIVLAMVYASAALALSIMRWEGDFRK